MMLGLLLAAGLVQKALIALDGDSDTNPAIFAAFRAIEARCLSDDRAGESDRCDAALDYLGNCSGASDGCTAAEYYCALRRLGFELPPFHIAEHAVMSDRVCG